MTHTIQITIEAPGENDEVLSLGVFLDDDFVDGYGIDAKGDYESSNITDIATLLTSIILLQKTGRKLSDSEKVLLRRLGEKAIGNIRVEMLKAETKFASTT